MFTYGYEIEFHSDSSESDLREAFESVGLPCLREDERRNGWTKWEVGYDAGGYEIRSPILNSMAEVREAMPKLERFAALVDAEHPEGCGVHIHFGGVEPFEVRALRNMGLRFINFEDVLDKLQTRYRRNSDYEYCRSNRGSRRLSSIWSSAMSTEDRDRLVGILGNGSRYRKLNFESLFAHGTLELRALHSTMDARDLIGQTEFFTEFFRYAIRQDTLRRRASSATYTEDQLFTMATRGMPPSVIEWARDRMARAAHETTPYEAEHAENY